MSLSPQPPDDFESLPTLRGLRPGDRILGRFKLDHCEGRGGMGEVWLASDQVLGEEVALKLLPRLIQSDDQTIEDLKKETRHGRQLAHPNIARVFDFYQDEENVGVAMEFVRGDNLARLRARQESGCFEASQIAAWAAQLLDALDYAHRIGRVVHRDLKPSNLLIESSTSTLKVVDFGIARSVVDSLQRVTRSAHNEGTLAYMSPEQAMGRSPNPLDDIYSAGATLYELLTGRPPFHTGDIATQIQKVPPMPMSEVLAERGVASSVPAIWESVVLQCLAKDRALRPQSAATVAAMLGLRQAQPELPASPSPPTAYDLPMPSPPTVATMRSQPAPTLGAIPLPSPGAGATRTVISTSAEVLSMPAGTGRTAINLTTRSTGPGTTAGSLYDQPKRRGGGAAVAAIVLALAGAGAGGWIWWKNYQSELDNKPPDQPSTIATTPGKIDSTAVPSPAPGTTLPAGKEWLVPDNFPKVQDAIDAAGSGQVIRLGKGTWNERLTLKSGIHLVGSSAEETIISSDARTGAVISCRGAQGITLEGLTISHSGSEPVAGAQPVVSLDGTTIELRRCHIKDGAGDGLLASQSSKVTLNDCEVTGNTSSGVSIQSGSTLTGRGGALSRNDRGLFVALASSSADLTNCRIEENYQHGVDVSDRGSVKLMTATMTGNKQAGVFIEEAGSSVRLEDCDISGSAPGVQVQNGASVTLENCRLSKNTNGLAGSNPGTVEIRNSKIRQNLMHGIALEAAASATTSAIQIATNVIHSNGQAGIFIGGSPLKPDVTGNDIGPNAHDLCIQDGAGGRYEKNVLRTKDEPIIGTDPAPMIPANQMAPGTPPKAD